MLTTIVGTIIVVFTAIFTYRYMQVAELNINKNIFIEREPLDVFTYFKNPSILQEIHHKIYDISVTREGETDDGLELWDYEIIENIPHVGPHEYSATTVADQDALRVRISFQSLYGLLHAHFEWRFGVGYGLDGSRGTLVTEESVAYTPYALENFATKTLSETHQSLLFNLKHILEGSRHQEEPFDEEDDDLDDDDWQEFER